MASADNRFEGARFQKPLRVKLHSFSSQTTIPYSDNIWGQTFLLAVLEENTYYK